MTKKKGYVPLSAHPFKPGSRFARPTQKVPERVTLDSPALDVMTDLKRVSVVNTRSKTPMEKANAKMIRYGVRLLLVLDEVDAVVGVITATDILGEKPLRFIQKMGGTHADILVRDIMTPQRELEVLRLSDVRGARVGQVLATLEQAGRQHAMVVEEDEGGSQVVCGLFSSTQIMRQLGEIPHAVEVAHSLPEVDEALGGRRLS
jgi:CBS domain-containing protein